MQRPRDRDNLQYGSNGANLADLLELGDNYAISVLSRNVKGLSFICWHASVQNFG